MGRRNNNGFVTERTERAARLASVFHSLGEILTRNGDIDSYEVRTGRDVHGRFQLPGDITVHIQGYPGMSNGEEAVVQGRLEGSSTAYLPFLGTQPRVPYDVGVLAGHVYADMSRMRERPSGAYATDVQDAA